MHEGYVIGDDILCNVISDAQFGFTCKARYSTTDAIFNLHWLISRSITKWKNYFAVLYIIKGLWQIR